MTATQQQTLLNFVFRPQQVFADAPNPLVTGKPWAIGNSVTQWERDNFKADWDKFEAEHPEIVALLPLKGA